MLICREAQFETWETDFSSSGQASRTWTRVTVPEGELTNALNWIDWDCRPVQVILCEQCGYTQCAAGGYVEVSRLADWILWTRAHFAEDAYRAREPLHPIVRRCGGIAIPGAEWERWRARVAGVPPREQVPTTTGRNLADAWFMSAIGPGRAPSLDTVVPTLRRRLLGCDTLTIDDAIDVVEDAVAWLEGCRGEGVRGRLVSPEILGARIERLYFDGGEQTTWPGLAMGQGRPLLALAPDLVFVPE